MEFRDGVIRGVVLYPLTAHPDSRGDLVEIFRIDMLPEGLRPSMGYVSVTEPGVGRGPHEHREQTDIFAFVGPGDFALYLWDDREGSPTRRNRMLLSVGARNPRCVVVPPGVVHAYRNVSRIERGVVHNFPDRLYAGWLRKEPVDEIRHEDERDRFYEDFVRQ